MIISDYLPLPTLKITDKDNDLPTLETPVSNNLNTAQIQNFTAIEDGDTNFADDKYKEGATWWKDDHATTITPVGIEKVFVATEFDVLPNENHEVVIGETVYYTVTLTIPEGETTDLKVEDTLDKGLGFMELLSVTRHAEVTSSLGAIDTNQR